AVACASGIAEVGMGNSTASRQPASSSAPSAVVVNRCFVAIIASLSAGRSTSIYKCVPAIKSGLLYVLHVVKAYYKSQPLHRKGCSHVPPRPLWERGLGGEVRHNHPISRAL